MHVETNRGDGQVRTKNNMRAYIGNYKRETLNLEVTTNTKNRLKSKILAAKRCARSNIENNQYRESQT